MKAIKRFDPTVGVRLVSFAVHWIRAEMHEYILRTGASSRSPRPRRSASCSSTCARARPAWAGSTRRKCARSPPTSTSANAKCWRWNRACPAATSASTRPPTRTTTTRRRRRPPISWPMARTRRRPTNAPTAGTTSSRVAARGHGPARRAFARHHRAAGWTRTARSRCRNSRTNTASPPNASARSRPTR